MKNYREKFSDLLNEDMESEIFKAFNKSKGNKKKFLKIINQETGLLPKAFKSGYLKDYMDTLNWK